MASQRAATLRADLLAPRELPTGCQMVNKKPKRRRIITMSTTNTRHKKLAESKLNSLGSEYFHFSILFSKFELLKLMLMRPAAKIQDEEASRPTRESQQEYKHKRRRRRRQATSEYFMQPKLKSPAKTTNFLLVVIFLAIIWAPRVQVGSANDELNEFVSSFSNNIEAQPLVFEFGSGEGAGHRTNKPPSLSSSSSSSSTDTHLTNADISSSLIQAKCWNNLENDNECKHLNFITAPGNSNRRLTSKVDDNNNDDLITPTVIFESSSDFPVSSIQWPPTSSRPTNSKPYMSPPYFSSSPAPENNERTRFEPTANDVHSATPATATILPTSAPPSAPITRPTIKNSGLFVATPQPGRKPTKTTTLGRRCRDENDADCDEPDESSYRDSSTTPSTSGKDDDGGGGDDDDDDDDVGDNNDTDESNDRFANEIGSGEGPADDNEDNSVNGDDSDDPDNSIESSGNSMGGPTVSSTTSSLLEVTSTLKSRQEFQLTTTTTTTARPTFPTQTGAEIELVVHSTLPPSFPKQPTTTGEPSTTTTASAASQIDASTTSLPDDTVTSRPIFPPTSSQVKSNGSVQNSADNLEEDNRYLERHSNQDNNNNNDDVGDNQLPISKPASLWEFKPMPLPDATERPPATFNQNQPAPNQMSSFQVEPEQPKPRGHLPKSELFWTTRRPNLLSPLNHQANEDNDLARPVSSQSSSQSNVNNSKQKGTDLLLMTLVYASIVVLVLLALIFAMVAFVNWRRNSVRRQLLLQKAHMMNGAGRGAQMAEPGGQIGPGGYPGVGAINQQPGLLSTYAPGKGMSTGKVTTSLAGQSGTAHELGQATMDEGDDEGQQLIGGGNYNQERSANNNLADSKGHRGSNQDNEQQQRASLEAVVQPHQAANELTMNNQSSWSTEEATTTTTTTTSTDSQRTQESVQRGQQQQPVATNRQHYPNSLSDGRQNSSSISDSQCSPEPGGQPTVGPAGTQQPQPMLDPMQNQQFQVGPGRPVARQPMGQPQMMADNNMKHPPYNQAASPLNGPVNGNHQMMMKQRQFAGSSGSFDSFQQRPSHVGFLPGPEEPLHRQHPMAANQQQQHQHYTPVPLNGLQFHPPGPTTAIQMPMHRMPLVTSHFQPAPFTSPQNKSMMAMQPMTATLGRRFPTAGLVSGSLNRSNIYSEDSSSFMTTSPSLARTSSSSSFAFNLAQQQPTPPGSIIMARPKQMDGTGGSPGRPINEHAIDFNSMNGRPPPVFGRPNQSEAWYV